jgi:hypothetical protein
LIKGIAIEAANRGPNVWIESVWRATDCKAIADPLKIPLRVYWHWKLSIQPSKDYIVRPRLRGALVLELAATWEPP